MTNDLPDLLRRASRALLNAAAYNELHDDDRAEFAGPWRILAQRLDDAALATPARSPYLTLPEAAEYLRRSSRTLRRYVDEGALTAYQPARPRQGRPSRDESTTGLLFRREDLDALLKPVEPAGARSGAARFIQIADANPDDDQAARLAATLAVPVAPPPRPRARHAASDTAAAAVGRAAVAEKPTGYTTDQENNDEAC